jgi:glycolate oxidase
MLYFAEPEDTTPYECDGLAAYRQRPMAVALPENEGQVIAILKICHELKVPVVPRGAGTGFSGGAMPIANGLVLSLAKFKKILDINPIARTAVVQPGVRNLAISEAVAQYGLCYAPRSIVPNCLYYRWQCQRELWWCSLLEIRFNNS